MNLELHREALRVHFEFSQQKLIRLPFVIITEANNQPEPDDQARSSRLEKRPDFTCALFNDQAPDVSSSQLYYVLECKRLGIAEGSWVLNENYSEFGIRRFVHEDWQYAKNCPSATMIGYLQNMGPGLVLSEVNAAASVRSFPQLLAPTTGWASSTYWSLHQQPLSRPFLPNTFQLNHFWVDLRNCQFVTPSPPAASKSKPLPKKVRKKKRSKS